MRLLLASSFVLCSGGAAFLACGSGNGATGNGKPDASAEVYDAGYGFATPDAWDQPITRPSDDAGAAQRAACTFTRGAMPAQTLGASTPIDSQIPIENIVVMMMENRSFDSMFGHLNEYGNRTDVQEPPANASNPSQAANWDAGAPAGGDAGGEDAGPPVTHPWMHAPYEC